MGDRNPPSKPDEQYPLLKIDGGGDVNHAQPAQTVVPPGWGVTCTKNSRFSRWPEFISACWMTLILCGISFLVFHALGISFYRRQQFIIMKCNSSKPASNVFYHQIVQRGSQIPFIKYSEYLANMATQYPQLQFNVLFLIDDFYPDSLRVTKRNIPASQSWLYNYKMDEIGKEGFIEFKRKYQNVNVTIIPLSKYMAMTPLKFRWRLLPQAHLYFYARVFSVWQNGGIGIDLGTYNNHHHNHLYTDSRKDAILRQHNDGINTAEYTKALSKIDNDEANAIFSIFVGIINNFLSETRSFFNKTLSFPPIFNEKSGMPKTHRSKKQTNNHSETAVITGPTNDPKDFYEIDNVLSLLIPTNYSKNNNHTTEASKNKTGEVEKKSSNSTDMRKSKVNVNGSDTRQVVLFYDFSIVSDNTGPSMPTFFIHKPSASSKTEPLLLSMDVEGTFIAASSKLHPFLGHLISSGCFGMSPSFAIQNALLTQCSGVFKDVYCNNIYIL